MDNIKNRRKKGGEGRKNFKKTGPNHRHFEIAKDTYLIDTQLRSLSSSSSSSFLGKYYYKS